MPAATTPTPTRSLLQGLDRLYQVTRLYGDTKHAGVRRAMDSLVAVIRQAFREGLEIGVTAEGLLAGGMASPETGAFWQACRERQLASISIEPQSSPADLGALVTHLSRSDAATVIASMTSGRIRLECVDLGGLAMGEGSAGRVDWQGVLHALGDGGEWTPEQAKIVNESAAPPEEVASALQSHVRSAAQSLKGTEGPERAQKLRKLRSFVQTLNPSLRRALLAQNSKTFASAENTLADLADVLPLKEVLEALRQVNASSARPSNAALRMFQQIARSCANDQQGAAELQHLSDAWRANTFANDSGTDALLVSIGELLQTVNSEEYCPETYLSELDKLGRQIERGETYAGMPTPQETSLRVAEISAEILATTPDGLGTNRMLSAASRSLGIALQTGRHATARDLIRAASRAISTEKTEHAARDTLARLDGVAEQLARSAHLSDAPDATLELLRTSEGPAIRWALAVLAEGKNEPNTTLWTFVHSAQTERVAGAIESMLHDERCKLPPLDRLCAPLEMDGKLIILWPMLNAASARVRRAAYHAISRGAERWPLRVLTLALSDRESDIQLMALDHLGPVNNELEARLIGGFLEGRGSELCDAAFGLAAQSLLGSLDPSAMTCLHTAFLKLMSGKTRSMRERAALLAGIIKRRRDHPLMRDAWVRWRLSACRIRVNLAALRERMVK